MTEHYDFQPDWVCPPGETIADILQQRNLSPVHFAEILGWTPERATELLRGHARITRDTAGRLEAILGGSAQFWINREEHYRRDLARLEQESRAESEERWLDEIPLREMVTFGWVTEAQFQIETARECLKFFDVRTVAEWRRKYRDLLETTAFKTSPSFESQPGAVAAWLRHGEIKASSIECRPWDSGQFRALLPTIRRLTRQKNPSVFVPELVTRCAESGVAVVVLRAPTGCRASGATYFVSPSKAALLLSFRYLADDHFWFTFFHEAGHLLLHDPGDLFLEIGEADDSNEEEQANEFAARLLVPEEFRSALFHLRADGYEVIRFARKVGVAPGIIVGQLQHYGRIRRNQLNNLKRRFQWGTPEGV
jgi:addiction module HigA family antidote